MGQTAAMSIARAPRDDAAQARGSTQPREPSRQVHRLGRYWALAVNRRLVDALGLAALAWAPLAGIAWVLMPA
jgi:hypothetical protein